MASIRKLLAALAITAVLVTACSLELGTPLPTATSPASAPPTGSTPGAETGTVTRVIDGDTIDVRLSSGEVVRVRYVGVNTPERDEVCYAEATAANAALVQNQQVRLERDRTDRDRFDRLLRYVYVGSIFVNAELVRLGWAEVVLYEPDRREFENFRALEQAAQRAGLGCHPTGIFDDGSYTR